MKQFEAGMRALLDTYIQADPVEKVATFDKGLVQLIVERGADAIDTLPDGIKKQPEAVAETIVNNVRKTIVDERAMNPKYYDRMSRCSTPSSSSAARRRDRLRRLPRASCSS